MKNQKYPLKKNPITNILWISMLYNRETLSGGEACSRHPTLHCRRSNIPLNDFPNNRIVREDPLS